jgi:hypothetical protein
MEAICSLETSVDTQRTTRRYIPEVGTLLDIMVPSSTEDIKKGESIGKKIENQRFKKEVIGNFSSIGPYKTEMTLEEGVARGGC